MKTYESPEGFTVTDNIYTAIENAVLAIFNAEIPLEDPYETTELIVNSINLELSSEKEE